MDIPHLEESVPLEKASNARHQWQSVKIRDSAAFVTRPGVGPRERVGSIATYTHSGRHRYQGGLDVRELEIGEE